MEVLEGLQGVEGVGAGRREGTTGCREDAASREQPASLLHPWAGIASRVPRRLRLTLSQGSQHGEARLLQRVDNADVEVLGGVPRRGHLVVQLVGGARGAKVDQGQVAVGSGQHLYGREGALRSSMDWAQGLEWSGMQEAGIAAQPQRSSP